MYKNLASSYRSFSLLPFLSFPLTSTSLYFFSLESTCSSVSTPLSTEVLGRKRRQVPRLSIALKNPKLGLHTVSTLTQDSDCTRRPSEIQERTRRFQVPTITRIVRPLRSSFILFTFLHFRHTEYILPRPFCLPSRFLRDDLILPVTSLFPLNFLFFHSGDRDRGLGIPISSKTASPHFGAFRSSFARLLSHIALNLSTTPNS